MPTLELVNHSDYSRASLIIPQVITDDTVTGQLTFDVLAVGLRGPAWLFLTTDLGQRNADGFPVMVIGKKVEKIMYRQIQNLAATTDAVDWDIHLMDNFDIPRIDIHLSAAPTTSGDIVVTKDSASGAAYDTVIRTVDPVGETDISILELTGFAPGDKINISYANADGRTITATATVEVL